VNGDEISIIKCEGRNVRGFEVLYDDLSQFQVGKVDRAVPACPLVIWISHFAFFDLCHDIWREHDENALGAMQADGTM
jgi:hypothetical protein